MALDCFRRQKSVGRVNPNLSVVESNLAHNLAEDNKDNEEIITKDVFTFFRTEAKEKEMNNTTNNDNWKDKATGMVCATCTNYAPKNEYIGRCRRNAPTMKGFPAVFPSDWCGDHKMNDVLVEERKKNAAV